MLGLFIAQFDMSWFDRYGFPLAALAVIAIAIWSTLRWSAPRIDRLFNRHLELIDSLEKNQDAQTDIMRSMHEEVRRVSVRVDEVHGIASEWKREGTREKRPGA